MAITFIDNQPIRFNSAKFDDQSCINKDLSGYSVLMQPGDPLYFQFKQYCCEDNLACDADELGAELVTDGDMSNPGAWTAGTNWAVAVGVATSSSGTIGTLSQGSLGMTTGASYQVQINIVSNSSDIDVAIFLGGRRIALIGANETGVHTLYGMAGTTDEITIQLNTDYTSTSTGELVIDDVSVKQIAICYTYDTSIKEYVSNGEFDGSSTGWTLGTGWTWVNAADDYVEHTTPPQTEPVSQTIANIPHRADILFSVTISNRTTGQIDFDYGEVFMQTLTGNATHSFNYPAYGLGNDLLKLVPNNTISDFDGRIDDVSATEESSGWSYNPTDGFCHETGWTNAFYAGNTLTIGRYYKMTIQVSMTEGELLIEAGGQTLGTVTQSGIYNYYFTATTTAGEMFTPSSDFDGCILPDMELCQLRRDYEFRLIYENGAGATDWHTEASSQDAVVYDGDWVTWSVTSLASVLSGGIPVALPYSCYKMQVNDFCAGGVMDSVQFTSDTTINYQLSHPCTKRIRAWADGESLGFNFGDNGNLFILVQRFRTLYMNPSYPNSGEDYEYSTGTIKRIFAKTEKRYEMLFDYMDEYAHDTMGNGMIPCDIFEIDGVEYLVVFKDYEPNWAERGKRNLAQSTIEIQKRIEKVLFNRNCS